MIWGRAKRIGGQNLYTNTVRRGPPRTPGRLFGVHDFFPLFSLENKLFAKFLVYTKPLFRLLRHLSFSELKTPLVYTFFPPNIWGEENVPENVVCSVVNFCTGKTEQRRTRRGPKPLLGRGVIREVFLPPLCSTQGNGPWVAPACADCPGFLVVGSPAAPASTLVSEPRIVPLS